ncbi:MAG: glycosyltransferase [Pseudomonadales bacterium]|nr:glycosyltransferase [Candidatus Woesebacteria bacterium]MCB9801449.1 glycosyltransferase [Pseudomonadales bacterium]
MPNVSLICTVLNEQETILPLLQSVSNQTRLPNETIIVDGGSTDKTVAVLKKEKKQFPHLKLKIIQEKTNRSEGRNLAIKKAKYDTIAITDAGCILDQNWLEELVKKQLQTGADVVAGYYRSEPKTPFEEAVVPFTLVMPDKVDPLNFLPATRSMLITKAAFKKVGFFNPKLDVSEDYEFAHRLKTAHVSIVFAREATVIWLPRSTPSGFFKMVKSMALGDATAGIIRPKVYLIFIRYVIFVLLLSTPLYFWLLMIAYSIWAVSKNKKYVSSNEAYVWLIALQYIADIGVMVGTINSITESHDA